jgi:hypothetical protein
MNLVDMILKLIGTGNTTNAISSVLGLNQDQTKRATIAAVPTLLAGLTHLSSTPQGAEQLSSAVSRQDTGLLDNLSDSISGQGISLADRGSDLLGSLLGGGTTSKLSGILSRFTGVGEGATGRLMGLLTPAILGVLGQQQRNQGLDASGLAHLLAGQKDNIRAAVPAGLGTMLSSVLPGASQLFETGRPTARTPEEAGRRTVGASAPLRKSSVLQWAIPLLLILGALGLFLFWSTRHRAAREAAVAPRAPAERETRGAPVAGVASEASQLITQATKVFGGIGDAASAQAAAPTLEDINGRLAGLRPLWDQLPSTARTSAQETLRPQVDRLKQAAQSVLDKPGVADAVRPQIEQIITNVDALAA